MTEPRVARGVLQFSLRSLFLLLLLVSVFFAGWATAQPRIQAQQVKANAERARAEAAERKAQTLVKQSEFLERRSRAQARVTELEREVDRVEARRLVRDLRRALDDAHSKDEVYQGLILRAQSFESLGVARDEQ